ncbi:MAG: DUF4936 family protein [Pseudomonadota bacterium]
MADLYIYYRLPDAHAALLAPRVHAMQASLKAAHGVAGQLKRRPASQDGQQTWMEIYLATGAGFDAALAAAVQQAAISDQIDGQRHTEVFMDVETCA